MVKSPVTYILLLFLLTPGPAASEDVRASARTDSSRMLIGDWLTVHLQVEHRTDVKVIWPSFTDSLSSFEVVRRPEPAVKTDGDNVLESATLILTAFDSGEYVVPPIVFGYTLKGDTSRNFARTSPIVVAVRGVAVDTTKEIRDIKPPVSLAISLGELLPYIIALALVAGGIWLLYYIRKKRRAGESIFPEEPLRPAHELALEALTALEAERLWQRGKVKEYHSELTDIVRRYIERRFRMLAMESTTDEILCAAPIKALPRETATALSTVLVRADLVKFAKFQPAPEENEASLPLAVSFVRATVAQAPAVVEIGHTAEVAAS